MSDVRRQLEAVRAWSHRIHGLDGPNGRHDWCIRAAVAILDDAPLPPAGPGTAFTRTSTAAARVETIRSIMERAA